jgi:hypothetical protein
MPRQGTLLEESRKDGEVRIKRREGREFALKPAQRRRSPLDVEGVDGALSKEAIGQSVRESRERG